MNDRVRYFTVESQSKYGISLTSIENIEDAGDNFISSEELEEMGVEHSYGGSRLFKTKIKDEIERLLSTIKEGRKSCIIDDEDLVEILKISDTPVSSIVEGTRRVGNRLFRHTKAEKTEPQKQDASALINFACRTIHDEHAFVIDFKYVAGEEYSVVIKLLKKLTTWKKISEKFNNQDLKWEKVIWDKPTLVDKAIKR